MLGIGGVSVSIGIQYIQEPPFFGSFYYSLSMYCAYADYSHTIDQSVVLYTQDFPLASFPSGNYKITKDSNNFYAYFNGTLLATAPYFYTAYHTPKGIGYPDPTYSVTPVSNMQFGDPEA